MDPADATGIELVLGAPRFQAYLDECAQDVAQARRLYAWQVAVASAMWGPIAVFEVLLRNALHGQLSYRAGREDWWEDPSIHLLDRERKQLDEAKARAQDHAERRAQANGGVYICPTPGHVVASSGLGLWVGLLSEGTPRDRLYSYETALWQPRLRKAFPHIGTKNRKQLHDECRRIQFVRNRIAHHEPLAPTETRHTIGYIQSISGAIAPVAETFVSHLNRASMVMGRREAWRAGRVEVYYL